MGPELIIDLTLTRTHILCVCICGMEQAKKMNFIFQCGVDDGEILGVTFLSLCDVFLRRALFNETTEVF